MKKEDARVTELVNLAKRHGGTLSPEAVVQRARDPRSALHDWFDWDDTEAARCWRLEQARRLLRVLVTVITHPQSREPVAVRAFFAPRVDANMSTPRNYTFTPTLLRSAAGRAALVETAKAELAAFARKYEFLQAFAPLFATARELNLLK